MQEVEMRKLIFVGFIALGVLVGLVSGVNGDWGTRIVMMWRIDADGFQAAAEICFVVGLTVRRRYAGGRVG